MILIGDYVGFSHRVKLDESLNKLSSEGFELNTGKVYAHDVYVGLKVVMTGEHGVYSFSDTGKKVQYATYMGPVVEVEPISRGCKLDMPGCNTLPGCGGTGCNFKGIACRSKGGNTQYVNFTDNQHNIPEVQKLNEYFKFPTDSNKMVVDAISDKEISAKEDKDRADATVGKTGQTRIVNTAVLTTTLDKLIREAMRELGYSQPLNSQERAMLINKVKSLGVKVVLPDINKSSYTFSPDEENNTININIGISRNNF